MSIQAIEGLTQLEWFYQAYGLSHGAGARDIDGNPVQIDSPSAVAFCAGGAAYLIWPDDEETRGKVLEALSWSVGTGVARYFDNNIADKEALFAWIQKARNHARLAAGTGWNARQLWRAKRAERIMPNGRASDLLLQLWRVPSSRDAQAHYEVDLAHNTCTRVREGERAECPDYAINNKRVTCAHLEAAFAAQGEPPPMPPGLIEAFGDVSSDGKVWPY
jgi:hypothetical protein